MRGQLQVIGAAFVTVCSVTAFLSLPSEMSVLVGGAGLFLAALFFFRAPVPALHPSLILLGLLFVTALPLIITLSTGAPIVSMSEIRGYYHQTEWITEALLVILAQCSMIIALSLSSRSPTGLLTVLTRDFRRRPALAHFAIAAMIITSLMANQTGNIFSGTYGTQEYYRDTGWFGGWPLLYVVSSATFFYATGLKRWTDYAINYAIVGFWIFQGNRSEILIQAVLPLVIFLVDSQTRLHQPHAPDATSVGRMQFSRFLVAAPAVIFIALLLQGVGYIRNATSVDDALATYQQTSASRGLAVSTVSPSAYTLVVAIGMTKDNENEFLYGSSYLNYIYRTLPSRWNLFPEQQEDLADTFARSAEAIGGAHFASEAYMNGGPAGALIFAAIVCLLLNHLLRAAHRDPLSAVALLALTFYLPRFIWYGNIYVYKLLIFFAVLYILRSLFGSLFRRSSWVHH